MRTLFDSLLALAALALLGVGLYLITAGDCPDGNCPAPAAPSPTPPCPAPKKPRWGKDAAPVGAMVCGPKNPDGTEVCCDYPGDRHRRNSASKGLGLCVFVSIHHACDWQDVPSLLEFPRWIIDNRIPGGGYPTKVAELIPQVCKDRNLPVPDYLQIESNDLDVLKAACAGGRMPCVTYSVSPTGRYGGRRIAHMVNLVHLDEKWAVILDNNHPGADQLEWMGHADFLRTYSGGRSGWAVVFLDPPPPMPPFNHVAASSPNSQSCTAKPRPRKKTCPCSNLCVCGCNAGEICTCSEAPAELFGVEAGKVGDGPRYRRNGREVTRDEALDALRKVPDDRGKHRLTVIGSAEERKRVLDDWAAHPSLVEFKSDFVARGYAPDHWHVAGYGFVTDGRPTIYVQDSRCAVLLRLERYDGPDELATTMRKLRPDYDPKKDPQGRLLPTRRLGNVPWSVWVVGGVAVLAYLVMRRKVLC